MASKEYSKLLERALTFIQTTAEADTWADEDAGWTLLNDIRSALKLKKITPMDTPTSTDFPHTGTKYS